jgi:hypothetical protein
LSLFSKEPYNELVSKVSADPDEDDSGFAASVEGLTPDEDEVVDSWNNLVAAAAACADSEPTESTSRCISNILETPVWGMRCRCDSQLPEDTGGASQWRHKDAAVSKTRPYLP